MKKTGYFTLDRFEADTMVKLKGIVFEKMMNDGVPIVFRFIEAPWCMIYAVNINSTLFCNEKELLEERAPKFHCLCNGEWLEEMFDIYWNAIDVGHVEVCALLEVDEPNTEVQE